MDDTTIRPSLKAVYFYYLLAVIVIAAGVWFYYSYGQNQAPWLMAIPCIGLLVPIVMHVQRRQVSMRMHDNHLTFESGFLSRTRRTVDMAKIQDVTVRQTLGQRLLGVGDLMLESAGEAGGMGMRNLDRPRHIADAIIAGSKQAALARGTLNTPPVADKQIPGDAKS
jgi:uncharacterized membrane protein YdbT with pleckstrin-like domain